MPESRRNGVRAQVAIVGAGPAGLSIARALATSGVRVVLIESGAETPERSGSDLGRWIEKGFPYPTEGTNDRGMGGTSVQWNLAVDHRGAGARFRELDPTDLQPRSWIQGSGWPFGIDELAPYYRDARVICGLAPLPVPAGEAPRLGRLAPVVFERGPSHLFQHQYAAELAASPSVEILTRTTVVRIETTSGGSVAELTAIGPGAEVLTITADHYVLAGGGVENARLLLANGLAPGSPVGRSFMEHVHVLARVWTANGAPTSGFAHASDTGPGEVMYAVPPPVLTELQTLGVAIRLTIEPLEDGLAGLVARGGVPQAIRSAAMLRDHLRRRRLPAQSGRHLAALITGAPSLIGRIRGPEQRMASEGESRVVVAHLMAEQAPSPHSRVRLSGRHRDAHGVPKAILDWRLGQLDIRSMLIADSLLEEGMASLGFRSIYSATEDLDARFAGGRTYGYGHHHIGTTRMHLDPSRGVVDGDGRVHGTTNLFVAGSSIFPTGGYANPTLTIVALASRLARHLLSE